MYDAAREGAAVAGLEERGVLAVTGPDRKKLLHSLLSNEVAGLSEGQGRLAALMDVKGRLLALMRVLVVPEAVLLEMPTERLAPVQGTLEHYRVAAPVRFAPRATAVVALLGPDAEALLGRLGAPVPPDGAESHVMGTVAGLAIRVIRAGDLPARGLALHASPEAADALVGALRKAGAAPLDRGTLDVLRIEDGRPWYGPDVTEENLLHETGLVTVYHSPSKGCYVGQEVVARLEARGANVSRRLRGLRLGAPASAGAAVADEHGSDVGRVTTSGISPRMGPVAIAWVHRSRAEPGSRVWVAGAESAVAELPLAEAAG